MQFIKSPDRDKFDKEFNAIDKEVHLTGSYWIDLSDQPKGAITIRKLSLTSLEIMIDEPRHIRRNDDLYLQFSLDDARGTVICNSVQVRSISGNCVQAVWNDTKTLDIALKTYISQS